jgi:hypothetical protein
MIDIQKLPDDVLNGVFKKRYKEVDNNDKFNIFKKKITIILTSLMKKLLVNVILKILNIMI